MEQPTATADTEAQKYFNALRDNYVPGAQRLRLGRGCGVAQGAGVPAPVPVGVGRAAAHEWPAGKWASLVPTLLFLQTWMPFTDCTDTVAFCTTQEWNEPAWFVSALFFCWLAFPFVYRRVAALGDVLRERVVDAAERLVEPLEGLVAAVVAHAPRATLGPVSYTHLRAHET